MNPRIFKVDELCERSLHYMISDFTLFIIQQLQETLLGEQSKLPKAIAIYRQLDQNGFVCIRTTH